jgi:HEAT repeat protein
VGHYLDKLLALARILDRGGRSVQQCLADNARDDEPPLRVRHLAALAEAFPDDALTLGACRRALEDADPATRLVGARALGREGAPTLVAMASDESLEASRRVEALAAWEVLPPTPDEARALLDALLAGTHSDVRLAAIRAAGHLRCAAVLPALLRLAGRARNEHVRELAVAFEEMGDEAAESVLVDLLVAGGEAVPPEVLRALGSLGSAASVEPLLPLATELIVPRAVKRAAREALRAIRSRLGTADVGRLSLVDLDDDAGALSLPDGASGDVSLAPEGAREDAS